MWKTINIPLGAVTEDNIIDFYNNVALTTADGSDYDNDGLNQALELELGTNPRNNDTDGDGIFDGDEISDNSSEGLGDTDGYITDPLQIDTDGDGLSDKEEGTGIIEVSEEKITKQLYNIGEVNLLDYDSVNSISYIKGEYGNDNDYLFRPIWDYQLIDSNNDGKNDSVKWVGDYRPNQYSQYYISYNVNWLKSNPLNWDGDGDQLSDGEEFHLHSNPKMKDTDGDSL
jgi:hypothetical protein